MVNQTKQEFRKQKLLVLEVQSIRAGPSPVGGVGGNCNPAYYSFACAVSRAPRKGTDEGD